MKKNMIKVEESFENVFDSSLIDYSSDFEKQDKVQMIKHWIETFCEPIHNQRVYAKDGDNKKWYSINDDFTIDVFCSIYVFLEKIDIFAVNTNPNALVNGEFPDYIKFNQCNGSFTCVGGDDESTMLKSLKGFPKIIKGSLDLRNNDLRDLKGCPDKIGWDLNVSKNIKLIKLIKENGGYPYGWAEYKNYKVLHEKYGFPLFGLSINATGSVWVPDGIINSTRGYALEYRKYGLIRNYIHGMKEENKQNMNESFNSVFDSSLIDYSNDFEEQDKQYKINQIKEWIQNNILISGNKGIGVKVYNPYLHRANWAANDMFWRFFEINDDYSIDIINPYPGSYGLSFTAEIFPLEWSTSKNKNSLEYIYSKKIGTLKEIPEYIKFNKCEGNFKIDNVKIESLQRFPEYVYESVFIRDTNIRTLKGGPIMVGGNYTIEDNHELCNFSGAPLECTWLIWKDYNKEYCPAINAVFPRYEDGKLINKKQVNNTRYLY